MNVHRVQGGLGTPVAPANRSVKGLDVTISDRGVDSTPESRQPAAQEQVHSIQVTSDPALQKLLSSEETQALLDNFPAAPQARGGQLVYNGRGNAQSSLDGQQGRLIDLVG